MSDSNLKLLRDRIDKIDQKLQQLLNERAEISIQVKAVKTNKKLRHALITLVPKFLIFLLDSPSVFR